MKLLLALYLLSLFFYSVSMLQCLKCESKSNQCIDTLTQQCGPDELCGYSAFSMNFPGQNENNTEVKRECVERKVCDQLGAVGKDVFATMDGGLVNGSIFMSCCESDNCNNITTPEPDTRPNGLKCLTCRDLKGLCNSTVSCVGNQDHCLTFKVLFFQELELPMGCVSKPLCGQSKSLFGQFQCCSGNLCNKRQSLDQSTPQN
ncbi:uncharacterized protein LOC128527108 [Clarias gariepinus]|uniref:uncharacterized protein LOC128527108 n=1 Tax=Clarias gariepinus TaxID=13013 RepID=UPI00234CD8BD|nr:uncharacterized protein LOC128527108 [Clarias gariepinus]